MFYTIYQITNLLNGKTYIGKHQTKDLDDGYMGSGQLLRRAIQKHGPENFRKEILHICDSEAEMNAKEKELVVISENTYNLCPGGHGGFGYINENRKNIYPNHSEIARKSFLKYALPKSHEMVSFIKNNPDSDEAKEFSKAVTNGLVEYYSKNIHQWTGKFHSDETKTKIGQANSVKQSGIRNSQYGTMWITNGTDNKKISKNDLDKWVILGYNRGRI